MLNRLLGQSDKSDETNTANDYEHLQKRFASILFGTNLWIIIVVMNWGIGYFLICIYLSVKLQKSCKTKKHCQDSSRLAVKVCYISQAIKNNKFLVALLILISPVTLIFLTIYWDGKKEQAGVDIDEMMNNKAIISTGVTTTTGRTTNTKGDITATINCKQKKVSSGSKQSDSKKGDFFFSQY